METRSRPEFETQIIGGRRHRLARTVVLVVAVGAALAGGPAVAAQLTTPDTDPKGRYLIPGWGDTGRYLPPPTTAHTPENADQRSGRIRSSAAQAYVQRPAYVRGKRVLIRIRADAANVLEDRGIWDLEDESAR